MEPTDILKQFGIQLLELPVHDPDFIMLLRRHNLLSVNDQEILRRGTQREGALYLVGRIESSLVISRASYDHLLLAMKECDDPNIKYLAVQMETASVGSTPLLKDLYQLITPKHAADWKVIGTLLGLHSGVLNAIEAGSPTNIKLCCNQMLEKWLEIDATASWRKLFNVIVSPAVYMPYSTPDKATQLTPKLDHLTITENEAVDTLSNRVSQINLHTRFMPLGDELWPPERTKHFTPTLLIHRRGGHCTAKQVTAITELTYAGDIGKITTDKFTSEEKLHQLLEASKATKEITEILSPLETSTESTLILIEGCPGIGKSVLLKEIAYRWGKKQLLQKFELVLLVCLCNPSLQQIVSVDDLLQLFFKGDKNGPQIASVCAQYLLKNGGKTLTLLLDGYDEYPEHLQKSSLVASILKRQVLPLCGLVVSSRPHASQHLREQATIQVDILGFTETEREDYIKQALPDQPEKIEELTKYLHQRPSVDSVCSIPFNMVMLLYLYNMKFTLPRNSTELYNHFICSTLYRHLSRFGKPLTCDITDLTDLPEPYNRIIKQLSKLSLEALNNNKLNFTLAEITAACPDIAAIPGAINGFGLLQAVQHYGHYAKTVTLNFIHFTIQEFLAAYYISHLPPNEELEVIKTNFWNDIHFNMFSMYISITKGQRPSFKTFLSDGNKAIAIADKFLKDQLKCLCLYRCFKETDDHTLCNKIETAYIFQDRKIVLDSTTLTASNMECISLFLGSSSNKEWERVSLHSCYIQDKGLNILYRGLGHNNDIIINTLMLSNNGLTTQSSSLIIKLIVKCQVKRLGIGVGNTIVEDQQFYSVLTNPTSVLKVLFIQVTELSSRAATAIFVALKENNKLKELYIDANDITDDACNAITTALKRNSCLAKLGMTDNPLSSDTIISIVKCLEVNNTLQLLGLPACPEAIQQNIRCIHEVVNKKRENRGYQVNLEIKFSWLL